MAEAEAAAAAERLTRPAATRASSESSAAAGSISATAAASSGSKGSPATAAPRRSAAGARRQFGDLLADRGEHRARQLLGGFGAQPAELAQEERVAARLAGHPLPQRRLELARQERHRVLAGQRRRPQLGPLGAARAASIRRAAWSTGRSAKSSK